MKDSETFDFTEEPVTEVELSAQDLLELSPSYAVEDSGRGTESLPMKQPDMAFAIPGAQPVAPRKMPSSMMRRMSAPTVAWALSLGVASLMVIGVNYQHSTPERPIQSSITPPLPQAEKTESSAAIERPPTLFTNPFDDTEVFEFPPGTSEAEARAVVADLLMKRAMDRQVYANARSSQ
jgi:hypothetical protein